MRIFAALVLCIAIGVSHGAELDRFFKIVGSVIQDPTDSMRIRRIENVEIEECCKACWEEVRCKTVEYKAEHRKCDLSTADYQKPELTIISSAYGWETFALLPDERALAEVRANAAAKAEEKALIEAEYATQQNTSSEVSALLENARSELEAMQESLAELADRKASFSQQHQDLEAAVERYRTSVQQAQAENGKVQSNITETSNSITQIQELISSLEQAIQEKNALIEQADSKVSGLKGQLKTAKSSRSAKQKQVTQLNTQIKDLKAAIEEADEPEIIKARDCAELYKKYETRESGTYTIYPYGPTINGVRVYCDMNNGGGWTVIQKRDTTKSCRYDFNRLWAEYKVGFGRPESDYWLGNAIISTLTSSPNTLRVEVKDSKGSVKVSTYSKFQMGKESEGYKLKEITYSSGNAGNSLTALKNYRFGTRDHENNSGGCGSRSSGGFWFKTTRVCSRKFLSWCMSYRNDCSSVNLNAKSAKWSSQTTYTAMKIRPSNF